MEARDAERILFGFTQTTVIEARGALVGFICCEECGAVLLLDPRETISVVDRHRDWHERFDNHGHDE